MKWNRDEVKDAVQFWSVVAIILLAMIACDAIEKIM